jgi:hypothetical protein
MSLAVQNDIRLLAPKFGLAVGHALNICHRKGLDVVVQESLRSSELQEHYYAQGRTRPGPIVTNARSSLYSWHGYGLAVDVISAARAWNTTAAWRQAVADVFKSCGLAWGGDWSKPDLPHFQWGKCRPSPSDRARELLSAGGLEAVWREVKAA